MHLTVWLLLFVSLLSVVMPLHQQWSSPFTENEREMSRSKEIAQKLKEKLRKLRDDLAAYNMIMDDVLNPKFEAIELQNGVSSFTTTVNNQLKTVSDLKEKLALHETFMNASLSRQEEQLSKLEPLFLHLENQSRNQSSEFEQVKQLWDDLGNKSVARAAEVMSLDHSIKGLDERLTQQEENVKTHELETTNLDNTLKNAEEALVSLQDDLQEALNSQGRLEGALVTLRKEMEELRASGGGVPAPVASLSGADALCKRLAGN